MRTLLLLLLPLFSLFSEDFISEFEYGQMLYRDPRGVSCVPCHGETGEGKEIARYVDRKGRKITVSGSNIQQATLAQIRDATLRGPGLMPRYFLTDKEIRTIHAYLKEVNRPKDTPDSVQKAASKEVRTKTVAKDTKKQTRSPQKRAKAEPRKKKINPWEGLK